MTFRVTFTIETIIIICSFFTGENDDTDPVYKLNISSSMSSLSIFSESGISRLTKQKLVQRNHMYITNILSKYRSVCKGDSKYHVAHSSLGCHLLHIRLPFLINSYKKLILRLFLFFPSLKLFFLLLITCITIVFQNGIEGRSRRISCCYIF